MLMLPEPLLCTLEVRQKGLYFVFSSDPSWFTETTQRSTVHDAPNYITSTRLALELDVQQTVGLVYFL